MGSMREAFWRWRVGFIARAVGPAVVEPVKAALREQAAAVAAQVTQVGKVSEKMLLSLGRQEARDVKKAEQIGQIRRQVAGLTSEFAELKMLRHRDLFGSLADAVARDTAFRELAREVIDAGQTLLRYDRLYTIWQAAHNVAGLGLPAAEVGCYRGGTTYFLVSALERLGGQPVEFHAFDTFEGHPATGVSSEDAAAHQPGTFGDVSLEDVKAYLGRFSGVSVHKGEFSEIAPRLEPKTYGLVHVDTDLYFGTLRALEYFRDRLDPDGVIVVDDYGALKCPGVRKAVAAFLNDVPDFAAWQLPSEQVLLTKRRKGGSAAARLVRLREADTPEDTRGTDAQEATEDHHIGN